MSDDRFAQYNQQRKPEPLHGSTDPARPTLQHIRNEVAATLQNYRTRRDIKGDMPSPWPGTVSASIDFFLDVIVGPELKRERPYLIPTRGKEGNRYEWGYQIRVIATLAQFLQMSQHDQERIAKGSRAGFRWRGEPVAQYEEIARVSHKGQGKAAADYLADLQKRGNQTRRTGYVDE
jgi:hypothetical protein